MRILISAILAILAACVVSGASSAQDDVACYSGDEVQRFNCLGDRAGQLEYDINRAHGGGSATNSLRMCERGGTQERYTCLGEAFIGLDRLILNYHPDGSRVVNSECLNGGTLERFECLGRNLERVENKYRALH